MFGKHYNALFLQHAHHGKRAYEVAGIYQPHLLECRQSRDRHVTHICVYGNNIRCQMFYQKYVSVAPAQARLHVFH